MAAEVINDVSASRWRKAREYVVASALLAIHLALLIHCSVSKSICYDEGAHLSSGLAYLRYGEFGIYNLSPPAMRMIGALPVYLFENIEIPPAKPMISAPPGSRAWAYYDEFQLANRDQLHRLVVIARLAVIPISAIGAILIWRTARALYGPSAGLVSLALWTFSPTVIAYGSTFGTDMPLAVGALAAVLAWIAFFDRATPARCLLAGMMTAAVCLVKFSGVLLLPLVLLLAVLVPRATTAWKPRLYTGAAGFALAMILVYVALCASFGFKLFGEPLGRFQLQSSLMQRLQTVLPAAVPVPFPRYLVEGFDAQKSETESVYYNILFGEGYFGSDWRYFPLHVFCKSTVGGMALAALVAVSFWRRRPGRVELCIFALAVLFVAGMVVLTQINIGATRYLLPAYPPLMILGGRVMAPGMWGRASRVMGGLALISLGAGAVESVLAAPRYHSFYNTAARDLRFDVPESDWGQSILELKIWLDEHPDVAKQGVAVLSSAPTFVEAYGLTPLQSDAAPAFVAISTHYMNGLPRKHRGVFVRIRNWKQLQSQKPIADFGGMMIFRGDAIAPPGEPLVIVVNSWIEAMADPTLPRMHNFADRALKGP